MGDYVSIVYLMLVFSVQDMVKKMTPIYHLYLLDWGVTLQTKDLAKVWPHEQELGKNEPAQVNTISGNVLIQVFITVLDSFVCVNNESHSIRILCFQTIKVAILEEDIEEKPEPSSLARKIAFRYNEAIAYTVSGSGGKASYHATFKQKVLLLSI